MAAGTKGNRGNKGAKESNQSFESLTRLLPGLMASYPAIMSLLGEQGVDKANMSQLMTAMPQILEKVKETDPEQLEQLVKQITNTIPGLEDVLPKR